MFTLKELFIVTVLVMASLPSLAARYTGLVSGKSEKGLYFHLEGQERIVRLEGKSKLVRGQLEKLGHGDFVSLFGFPDLNKDTGDVTVAVSWIEFVGLKNLIGLWANDSQDQLFEFRNFSDLDHYLIEDTSPQASKKSFHYNIAPAKGEPWKVFLSDSNSVMIGSIMFRNDDSAALVLHSEDNSNDFQFFDLKRIRTSELSRKDLRQNARH